MSSYYWDEYNNTSLGKYLDFVEKSFYYNSVVINNIVNVLDVGGGSGRISIPLVEKSKIINIIENDRNAIINGLKKCNKLKNLPTSSFLLSGPALSPLSSPFLFFLRCILYLLYLSFLRDLSYLSMLFFLF